ncbi:MAG: HNH endonuclease [Proteobacteria bacterium]|nr:HNH endonuclease [Pseudomonadota bacterium]
MDTRGHIGRAVQAKDEFRKAHPCPATGKISGPCPGFVVEHIVPLSRGGADRPANMQWQAVAVTKPRG